MTSYTITATCAGESATAVVDLPDLSGTLDVTADEWTATAVIAGLSSDTTVTVDWGDGTEPETVDLTGGGATATHTYSDASGSPYTVTVTGNTSGAVLTAEVTLDVGLVLAADTTADPEVAAAVTGIWPEDTTITIDYGDGTMADSLPVTDGTAEGDHTYTANGTYTITVTGDTTGQVDTVEVTIAGVDDTGTLTATNTDGYLAARATIAGFTGDTTGTIDWGDGTTTETVTLTDGAATATHDYSDDTGSPYTITFTGDTTGGTASDTVTVTVHEPLSLDADTAADPDVTFTVTGVWGDDATVTLDYGDGTTPEVLTVTDGTATATHTYTVNGDYTATVTGDTTAQTDTATVTIAAAPMTATADDSADPTVDLSVINIDPTDTTVTVDWGDGA